MIHYATQYVSPRSRPLTEDEQRIRQVAYDLKIPTPAAIAIAAPAMAALLGREPCWLIPIPSSSGSTEANLALCYALKGLIPGSRIVVGIRRIHPVESSCARRRRGLLGLSVDEHAFVRCCGPLLRLPVWLVDNVVTTGATLRAAHHAFGTGDGVVYADASSHTLVRINRIDWLKQHPGRVVSRQTGHLTSADRGREICPNCDTGRDRRQDPL